MAVVEHVVEMELRGNPRWWTVTNRKGSVEIVRLEVEIDLESDEARKLVAAGELVHSPAPVYVVMPPGYAAWPPLAAVGWFMGLGAQATMRERGAKIWPMGHPQCKQLEERLAGVVLSGPAAGEA